MEPRHDKRTPEGKLERKQARAEVESEVLETAVGAAAGAMAGALAGPVGIAIGAGIGGAAGVALGHQTRNEERERAQHERDLENGMAEGLGDEMPGRDSLELDADLEAQAEAERLLEKPATERADRSRERLPRNGSTRPRSRVAVLYATREGQARRVAERVAGRLRADGAIVDVDDVAYAPVDVSMRRYGAVILVASTHLSRHEREMVDFVKDHREDLESIHTAFLSVSLSEAGAEMKTAPPEQRAKGAADARAMIEAFCAETGWRPERTQPVAGALRYSQYGFVVRFFMRAIAKKMGGATDTSRDVEYTDWDSLDQFVDDFATSSTALPDAAASTGAIAGEG